MESPVPSKVENGNRVAGVDGLIAAAVAEQGEELVVIDLGGGKGEVRDKAATVGEVREVLPVDAGGERARPHLHLGTPATRCTHAGWSCRQKDMPFVSVTVDVDAQRPL